MEYLMKKLSYVKEANVAMANEILRNAALKRNMLETAKYISKECDYDYYSNLTFDCKRKMKEIQLNWKRIGSAGNQEKMLWNQFKTVQDIFWKKIRLVNIEMKILEMSDESDKLHDDFEIALSEHKSQKAEYLYEAYERKQDKIADLSYEQTQIEEELWVLQEEYIE